MNRRAVIKNLALVVGAAVVLPSCLHEKAEGGIALKRIKLDGNQQKLIADISETIIPKTTTPGAKDLNVHLFVLKMLDDCYTKKDQETFITGLSEFNNLVSKNHSSSFGELNARDREAILNDLEKNFKPAAKAQKSIKPVGDAQKSAPAREKKPEIPPLNLFYGAIKQQTIFGYTNSQYFMTKQIVYELVPGRWNAHFPVKNLKIA